MLHSTAQACKLARCFPPAQRRRSWPSARSPPFPSVHSLTPPTNATATSHPPTHPPAVAAVHDGYLLQKSVTAVPLAGRTLARCMAGCVAAKGAAIRPRFEFRRKEGAGGAMEARTVHACMRAMKCRGRGGGGARAGPCGCAPMERCGAAGWSAVGGWGAGQWTPGGLRSPGRAHALAAAASRAERRLAGLQCQPCAARLLRLLLRVTRSPAPRRWRPWTPPAPPAARPTPAWLAHLPTSLAPLLRCRSCPWTPPASPTATGGGRWRAWRAR